MKKGLTNNQLKIIAMITMTVDHAGLMLFPDAIWMRIIGRLAYPIYAYMIAEGCNHTRSMGRYLGTLSIMALVCQLAYTFTSGSLVQSILVTFSLSVGLVWILRWARSRRLPAKLLACAAILLVLFLTEGLPMLLPDTDYSVEYDFIGVILPVVICFCPTKKQKLLACALLLSMMSAFMWPGQWFSLLAVPILAMYNGRRGRLPLKWIFYLYFPIHLLLLQGLVFLFY